MVDGRPHLPNKLKQTHLCQSIHHLIMKSIAARHKTIATEYTKQLAMSVSTKMGKLQNVNTIAFLTSKKGHSILYTSCNTRVYTDIFTNFHLTIYHLGVSIVAHTMYAISDF